MKIVEKLLPIVHDARYKKINSEVVTIISVVLAIIILFISCIIIKKFTPETSFLSGYWLLWGWTGLMFAKILKIKPLSIIDFLISFPLLLSFVIGIFIMNLFYLPFRKKL